MRDHDALHVRVGQMLFAMPGELEPDFVAHVLAIHLSDLFGNQPTRSHFRERRNRLDQILHTNLRSGVTRIGTGDCRSAGYRPARPQQYEFFCNNHLRLLKNCSKIQALDI